MKIRFNIHFHTIWEQTLYITGSIPELGNWNIAAAKEMQYMDDGNWTFELNLPDMDVHSIEYKFFLFSPETPWRPQSTVRWETGNNRIINLNELKNNTTFTVSQVEFQDENPRWKGGGVAIPVFALRTRNSFGIGDFGDLFLMIDWVKKTNQKIIQILPINDTTMTHTWLDSYPYNAISIYALHPLYLSLNAMGILEDSEKNAFYKEKQQELNRLPVVDYEEVDRLKWDFFREIFQQEGEKVLTSQAFTVFFEENKEWLIPYADYSGKRDNYPAPGLYYYIQFHAHQQLRKVRNYARHHGIILKGDIPIGISRESVEALTETGYFNMNFQAGAPPDDFSVTGQNWGFPTYNWNAMEAGNYHWWKKRFRKMADYFDAYRIDHILGFFRIWQIPVRYQDGLNGYFNPALPLTMAEIEHSGLEWQKVKDLFIEDEEQKGKYHPRITAFDFPAFQALDEPEKQAFSRLHHDYFYIRHNEFWKEEALKHLTPLVNATDMLVCGEDLGMIPHTVPEVMNKLQILSLEIERMPKSPDREFTDLNSLPYHSVCTTSTHDMTTLRAWWKEDKEKTQRYYNEVLHREGEAPADCTPEISEAIIRNHLNAPSMLTIIPLQDWLAMDEQLRTPDPDAERINIPAYSRHYWRYRMHLTIEELLQAETLNVKIRELIRQSARNI